MLNNSLHLTAHSKKPKIHSTAKKILFFLTLLCFVSGFSQSQKSLESKRAKLQQEIKKVNTLLFKTKKEEKNLLHQVGDLNRKIKVRTKLISTIDQEAQILNKSVKTNSKKIKALEKDLQILKDDYAEMIYKSYKGKSLQSRMMFVFSSKSFNQAYKRLKYMKQYTTYRKKQGEEIIVKTDIIKVLNDTLKVQKTQKDFLLSEHREEQSKIESEKKEQEILITKVKSKEKKYISEIRKKQKEERKIDAQIEKLIRDAIAASKKKNKSKSKSAGFFLTPEAKALASKFQLNKGKLPWPVTNALVVRRFGTIPHETLSGITIQSNGIHIATNKNSTAKTIFEGSVLAIQVTSEGLKTVMIQHGNYITLYSNLETVTIQKGDKVSLNQNLGKIHTDKVTGKTILKFQIWRDTKKENPSYWLLKI
jgi:septal ring factor EnvC (AmiA/AmiB activator)